MFLSLLGLPALFIGTPAKAACSPLPNDKGQATQTINVSDDGQYKVWLRMLAPNAESNSVAIQVGDNCPIIVTTDQLSDFTWAQAKSGDGPATLNLTAGEHTIKVAGIKTGSGADKVLLLADSSCLPTGLGINCQESKVTAPVTTTKDPTDVQKTRSPNWWLIGMSATAAISTLAFMIFKYLGLMRRIAAQQIPPVQPATRSPLNQAVTKAQHFWQHHKFVVLAGVLVVGASLTVGITGATSSVPSIEVDAAQLSGGAKIADHANASGGRYVVFENNPPATASNSNTTASQNSSNTTNQQTGNSNTGGNNNGGGGGSSTPSCALPNYPDASCTGVPAGVSLTTLNGNQTYNVAGTVVEGKIINGCVNIEAPNVTIRKSKINCDWAFAVRSLPQDYSGGGLLLEDVEISCLGSTATAVASYGFTARRLNVHSCENAFSIDNTATMEDSYIHDLTVTQDSHTDGIQLGSDVFNVTVSHNTILSPAPGGTSAIIGDTGNFSNVLLTNNLFAGGAYTLYCPINGGSNYRVTNNHFSRQFNSNSGVYGPWVYCDRVAQATGNVWHDTLQAVSF